jgi:hypothetical protein
VSSDIDEPTFLWIERAFAEHPVLVFPNQHLDAPTLAAFGSRFGHPQPHLLKDYRHPDHPMVSFITNVTEDGAIDEFGSSARRVGIPTRPGKQRCHGSPSCMRWSCRRRRVGRYLPICGQPMTRFPAS